MPSVASTLFFLRVADWSFLNPLNIESENEQIIYVSKVWADMFEPAIPVNFPSNYVIHEHCMTKRLFNSPLTLSKLRKKL